MDTQLFIPATVRIQAAEGRKGPPTFEAVFYTGGPLNIAGYDGPVAIDLAGLVPGNVLVANLDHDPQKRVGNFEVHNDGRQLVARGVASAATAARDEVIASARDGYIWQASLEVQPNELTTIKRGESIAINGRTLQGPLTVTTRGTLKGFAFVSHGADDETFVSIAAKAKRNAKMVKNFTDWAASCLPTGTLELMTAEQMAALHANYQGRSEAIDEDRHAVAPLMTATAGDPVAAEGRRIRQIEAATAGDFGDHADKVSAIKAQAIAGDVTVDELLKEVRQVRAMMETDKLPMAHTVRASHRGASADVMAAALCQSINLPNLDKHFSDQTLQAAHSAYRGQFGLQQLLLASAAANGYGVRPGVRVSVGNLREVLAYAFPEQRAAAFSTLSVPGILSNVGNKSVEAGWAEGDQSWREIAAIKSSSDFKTHTSYRLGDSLEYELVSPDGEIPHGELSEESYERKIHTYAKMFSLTRVDIINDDLGAFEDLRIRLGRGGILKLGNIVWARFMDNATFFHTDHNNVSTGSPGSVLGTDGVGLQAAVLKFRKLLSADGKGIDGEPVALVVPPELEFNARRLYQSTNIISSGDTDATTTSANVFGGLYRPIVQRRLSDSSYTGYSTTAHYLLRDPRIAAVVAVSFLNGQQTPTVETADADFNTLGIQARGFHDFGASLTVDYLAGVRSAGA